MPIIDLRHGDVRAVLASLPAGSVQTCITSPPYWGLRDYGTEPLVWGGDPDHAHEWAERRYYTENSAGKGSAEAFSEAGQSNAERVKAARWRLEQNCACGAWRGHLGLEPTPELFVQHLVEVFREVRRVLRDDGTLWLNLGDSYARTGGTDRQPPPTATVGSTRRTIEQRGDRTQTTPDGLKQKDLVGIPWMVAFALRADGWYLRSDIVWAKPNPMPESVTDRPTKAHEYMFLLAKSDRYFYDKDAVSEPSTGQTGKAADFKRSTKDHVIPGQGEMQHRENRKPTTDTGRRNRRTVWSVEDGALAQHLADVFGAEALSAALDVFEKQGAPLSDVWRIATKPFKGAHFAVFPEKLVEPCILAGSSERGQCSVCGAPWRRVLESRGAVRVREGSDTSGGSKIESGQGSQGSSSIFRTGEKEVFETIGWGPSCGHGGDPVPQTILDPFCGSGTTGAVARRLGRHFIGIDLNETYLTLARQRLGLSIPEVAAPEPLPVTPEPVMVEDDVDLSSLFDF